jgi:uncharacterized protein (DUF1778 family)
MSPVEGTSGGREARISLRVSTTQAALLKQAAESQGKTLTDFVLSNAAIAAERALADRRLFVLGPEQWAAFEEMLERPARLDPRLRDLVQDDSFFVD